MLFHSFAFLVFFPCVVAGYFALPQRWRWVLLLTASYLFYGWWRIEYLGLIIASTLIDYYAGIAMGARADKGGRRKFVVLSLLGNLGLLGAFKYFNFFNTSLGGAMSFMGFTNPIPYLDVLLPVGISFYTFQSLSYTIDVYRGLREPERHLGVFALYVSFFPQLVAGPIERSTRLLPQFYEHYRPDYGRIISGLRVMLWGFFLKLAVADRLAPYVDEVYGNVDQYEGVTLIIATYFFAFQIYCDFAGYSFIAIGAAKVMGFSLMENFRRPFFAPTVSQFWREWHISLSTWFRDYLYIPLGGSRVPEPQRLLNLFIVFAVSGLWHGARWNTVVWGCLHGAYVVFETGTEDFRNRLSARLGLDRVPRIRRTMQTLIMFHLVWLGWVFFRGESFRDSILIFERMVTGLSTDDHVVVAVGTPLMFLTNVALVIFLNLIQLWQGNREMSAFFDAIHPAFRWILCYVLLVLTLVFGAPAGAQFIYFQF